MKTARTTHMRVPVSTMRNKTEFINGRGRVILPDCLGCLAIFASLLAGLGYLAYLPGTADQSDCRDYPATIAALDHSRENVLTLSERPQASRCGAYRAHVAALAKARSAGLRCTRMLMRQSQFGDAQQDSSPEMLLFEENFYRRLIDEKCGAAR